MITSYEFRDSSDKGWHFSKANYGPVNLIVGATGSGKSRFLNSLFNIASSVSSGQPYRSGQWAIELSLPSGDYLWSYRGGEASSDRNQISHESLKKRVSAESFETVFERNSEKFIYRDQQLPRLPREVSGINLLKEEDAVKDVYQLFSHMQRRKFAEGALMPAVALQNVPHGIEERFEAEKNEDVFWAAEFTASVKLYLFKKYWPEKYKKVTETFQSVFPTMREFDIKFVPSSSIPGAEGKVPLFMLKEKGVHDWIDVSDLSSGMQKVLLLLTDIISLPVGATYIIDEYENSLGVNAIDFFPPFLSEHGEGRQFFVTTHHPYLINTMPIKNWRVFHRSGSVVTVVDGRELQAKYGKSKQQAFVQLLNDPIYRDGAK